MFGARYATLGDRVAGMQIGPMGGDMEPAGFGTDQGVFVGLGRRQGGGGNQLGQLIFEHAFNIWVGADTPQRLDRPRSSGQHLGDPDNTSSSVLVPAGIRRSCLQKFKPGLESKTKVGQASPQLSSTCTPLMNPTLDQQDLTDRDSAGAGCAPPAAGRDTRALLLNNCTHQRRPHMVAIMCSPAVPDPKREGKYKQR
jgi:hypothetical protein